MHIQVNYTVVMFTVFSLLSFGGTQELLSPQNEFEDDNRNFLFSATEIVVPIISFMILFMAVCYCLRKTVCQQSATELDSSQPEIKSKFQQDYFLFGNQHFNGNESTLKGSRKLNANNAKQEAHIVVIPTLLNPSLFVSIQEESPLPNTYSDRDTSLLLHKGS